MTKLLTLVYGIFCYLVFFLTFLYLVGFLSNFGVPKSIDSGEGAGLANSVLVNLSLIVLFGLQHSIMARPWFKKIWTLLVPQTVERSTYVLVASIVLILVYALWQPIPYVVWQFDSTWIQAILWATFMAGFLIVLLSTFMTDHFDLFGLRQVYLNFAGRVYQHPKFRVIFFYRLIRHPLYAGMFLGLWATPHMSAGHFLFAAGLTVYVLIAVGWEEDDLVEILGDRYRSYKREVPMFIPRLGKVHETVLSDEAAPTRMR